MDVKKLKIKIEEIFNHDFLLCQDIGKNQDIYDFILSIFNKEELNYINEHQELLKPYIDIELDAKIIKRESNYFLKTNIGTYFIGKIELSVEEKIKLIDFYDVLNCISFRHFGESSDTAYEYLLIELIEKYTYYKIVKNKNVEGLKFLCKWTKDIMSEYKILNMPVEFFDNPSVYFYSGNLVTTIFEKLKSCYESGYKFDNNQKLMFLMIINTDFDDAYIKQHITEFKQFIIQTKFNRYSMIGYDYMKEHLLEYMDDQFLTELYKKNPKFFFYDNKVFSKIAKNIPNNSPKIRLTKTLPTCHLRYHPYDLYAGKPAFYDKDELSDFEGRFLNNNDLVVKLYNIYYRGYKEKLQSDELDNLYDFIKSILLNCNNFKKVVNNPNFSIQEIQNLMFFKYSLNSLEQEQFENFYERYRQEESNKWISLHNELVKNKNDISKCIEIFEKYGLNKDNIFHIILNNKFMNKNIKSLMIKMAKICYGESIKVIDIINILDEMINRNLTFTEILNERNIIKKDFDKLYQDSYENNPILHEYIKMSLSKNKRLGYIKLIRLGYAIINSNLQSYDDFQKKFPKYNYNIILEGLKNTELENQLITLTESWKDYQIEIKKRM